MIQYIDTPNGQVTFHGEFKMISDTPCHIETHIELIDFSQFMEVPPFSKLEHQLKVVVEISTHREIHIHPQNGYRAGDVARLLSSVFKYPTHVAGAARILARYEDGLCLTKKSITDFYYMEPGEERMYKYE